jgi:ribosomal protein S27E
MTTTTTEKKVQSGEVNCLNCGRTLALAARRADGVTTIRPLRRGSRIEVSCPDGTRLRCNLCGGRAFLEFERAA